MTYEFCSYKKAAYTAHIYYIIYINNCLFLSFVFYFLVLCIILFLGQRGHFSNLSILFSYKEAIIKNVIKKAAKIDPIALTIHPILLGPFVNLNIYIPNAARAQNAIK